MKKQVLCFGEVLWDVIGKEKKAGGAPMNVARHLVQQHVDVQFASRVGDDKLGTQLTTFLKESGLYSNLIQVDSDLTTCEVKVILDAQGQATYVFPERTSWDNIQVDDNLLHAAKNAASIVFGSLACRDQVTHDTLLNLLDETDAVKIFDVNLRPPHYTMATIETLAARASVVKMNEDEANLLVGGSSGDLKEKITEFRKKYHTKTICVTRGENGAIIWHDYEFFEHPGYAVNVEDTVGAGDAFLASFIAGIVANKPIPKLLDNACAIGAYVTTKRGANPVYVQDEIDNIKNSRV